MIALAKTWFPKVECSVSRAAKSHAEKRMLVERYLEHNDWLDGKRDIRQAERAEILFAVNRIAGENAKNLGSLLSRYGFSLDIKTRSKKSNAPYMITRIPASVEEAV